MATSPWLDPTDDADLELITAVWADAPTYDDGEVALELYLEAAQEQCVAFLDREIDEDTEILATWKLALIYQTRALWQSGSVGPEDQTGDGSFRVTVFPMDWTVKNLLRPKRGKVRVR